MLDILRLEVIEILKKSGIDKSSRYYFVGNNKKIMPLKQTLLFKTLYKIYEEQGIEAVQKIFEYTKRAKSIENIAREYLFNKQNNLDNSFANIEIDLKNIANEHIPKQALEQMIMRLAPEYDLIAFADKNGQKKLMKKAKI